MAQAPAQQPSKGTRHKCHRWVKVYYSRAFRGKFLALLRSAFDRGRPSFHGTLRAPADTGEFRRRPLAGARTEWVVYAKPPFGGPRQVLIAAHYTQRAAISNRRLVVLEIDEVQFHWKDYAQGEATGRWP